MERDVGKRSRWRDSLIGLKIVRRDLGVFEIEDEILGLSDGLRGRSGGGIDLRRLQAENLELLLDMGTHWKHGLDLFLLQK